VRVGFAPITWNNEDLAGEFAPPVAYTTVLAEVASAGYAATELGDGFPRDAATLHAALQEHRLSMPSAWCGLHPLRASATEDLQHTRQLCRLLAAVGALYVNLADQGTPERKAFAGRADAADAPRLGDAEWDVLAERVCQAAETAGQFGLEPVFHPHVGTWVETRADIEQLLQRAPRLKLVLDVGHALYASVDPLEVVRSYSERIAYIHLKDVDADVLADVRHHKLGFEDAIRRRIFTELGRGLLDVPAFLATLRDVGYDGWLMVEQDSTWLTPVESARASRDYLRSLGV
jgi:inosose dehydratase